MVTRTPVPRGRHAPPLEVRRGVQRTRLLEAAAEVFAARGYADASAEAVARAAGMSKATFYEHFANKEEAILALFDEALAVVTARMADAVRAAPDEPEARIHAGLHAVVETFVEKPAATQTLLVEIIGAGPRAIERRDVFLGSFARIVDEENRRAHERAGAPRFRSEHDAFGLVGAIVELVSRHLRLGVPGDVSELEPVIERLIVGLVRASG